MTSLWGEAQGGVIRVQDFLAECSRDREPCLAFVMGVIEGARQQTREHVGAQPYSYLMHGEPVCLPEHWTGETLTERVLLVLRAQPETHRYSAVSGVLFALAGDSECQGT